LYAKNKHGFRIVKIIIKKIVALSKKILKVSNKDLFYRKRKRREEKMKRNEKEKGMEGRREISLPRTSSAELRGRQSVRATFRLSGRAIEALSIVSAQLGIKQKSLFDHLMEDLEALHAIAEEFQAEAFEQPDRIQKTYVLSRRTLSSLDEISRSFDTPRDALVEYSIQRLIPLIAREREKHRMRKEILGEMTAHLKEGEKRLEKAKELLGGDDPVYGRFETALKVLHNAHRDLESFVERGELIEEF
jgi:hypothetical protein